jgi:hypothetical protein
MTMGGEDDDGRNGMNDVLSRRLPLSILLFTVVILGLDPRIHG